MAKHSLILSLFILFSLLYIPLIVSAECTCEKEIESSGDKNKALKYKIVAIATILFASSLGVAIPVVGKKFPSLRPESNLFFLIKAFAAGVILSTGFVHILPDAFESLTNPCLSEKQKAWGDFPFAGLIAMLSAIATMMIDAFTTSYYNRTHFNNKASPVNGDEETQRGHEGHIHVHTHATHGHSHGPVFVPDDSASSNLFRHRIISQVLEVGIIAHSIITGISLGASEHLGVVKPLVAALTFHQFFEGMGLGGCITQAKFKSRSVAVMAIFFSLTTPTSIAIGIGISHIYDDNSPTALVVEGVFNSASAGILIYMALVDLLAEDFMNPIMQGNLRLHLGSSISLFLGAGCMSLLAKWA